MVLSKSIKETVEKHIGETHDVRVCYNPCPKMLIKMQIHKRSIFYFPEHYTREKVIKI